MISSKRRGVRPKFVMLVGIARGIVLSFPSLHANRAFADGDITQLANLCHNCRGCFYACQYTAPHEFDLNLPQALAEVRQGSWEEFAFPSTLAKHYQKNGLAIAVATIIGFVVLVAIARWIGQSAGEGFYQVMSHGMMVSIFAPAFLFPILSIGISLRRYWRATGGKWVTFGDVSNAFTSALSMKNLAGGHGDGCNFEDEDRFSILVALRINW